MNPGAGPTARDGDLSGIVPQAERAEAADLGAVVERVTRDGADLAHVDIIRVHAPIIGVEGVDYHAVADRIAVLYVTPLINAGRDELLLFSGVGLRDDGQAALEIIHAIASADLPAEIRVTESETRVGAGHEAEAVGQHAGPPAIFVTRSPTDL